MYEVIWYIALGVAAWILIRTVGVTMVEVCKHRNDKEDDE
jgi:hypothetical protein